MKQETIDFIKAMTSQGLLVVVDAETYNGEIITITCSKKPEEEQLLKEEPKPEIDLLQCDGRRFRAKIEGATCEGIISIEDGLLFLCQNNECGAIAKDKKGFKFSWRVHPPFTADGFENYDVTDFELLPEHRVIFTNCVGEVFTEEDAQRNSTVFRWDFEEEKICAVYFNLIHKDYYGKDTVCTEIFRSKKSLLKYLYETCD